MRVLETERLELHELELGDAGFVLELLNDPTWLASLPDRGVRTLDDARGYLEREPLAMYAAHGMGLWRVDSKDTGEALGICGLLRREFLDDVDLGFALLERHQGRGYALEAARGCLEEARRRGLARVVAITTDDNAASRGLLERLGFALDGEVRAAPDAEPLLLYAVGLT